MLSPGLHKLIRGVFSDEEWRVLTSRADFVAEMEAAESIEAAEQLIIRGAQLQDAQGRRRVGGLNNGT